MNALLAAVFLLIIPARAATATKHGAYAGFNIIVLSLGNVGAHHMSLYGYARKTTPRLDAIAKDALVFEEAFSPTSWTLPVAASIFTALAPYNHGIVHRLHGNVLDPAIRTLPEVLRDGGYRTAAFTGGLDYHKSFSIMRGFQETDSNPNFTGLGTTLRQAQDWLSRNGRKNFFLFIHGYDTHCPFAPAGSARGAFSGPRKKGVTVDETRCVRGTWNPRRGLFESRYRSQCFELAPDEPCSADTPESVLLTGGDLDHLRDRYDETILSADAKVGAFLSSLDKSVRARTIVVVLAEHGEMFGKDGRFGRTAATEGTLYDDVVHVPLMILIPGVSGRRISGLAELGDLAPTLARLVGVHFPLQVQGKDLSPLIWGGTSVREFTVASRPFMWMQPPFLLTGKSDSIRSREWKLIREIFYSHRSWRSVLRRLVRLPPKEPREKLSLYHLTKDPNELQDLSASRPEVVEPMLWELEARIAKAKAFNIRAQKSRPIPKHIMEDARSRGYW